MLDIFYAFVVGFSIVGIVRSIKTCIEDKAPWFAIAAATSFIYVLGKLALYGLLWVLT